MNILNQRFDSDEDDEDYVPKAKELQEFTKVEQNDALVELKKQKQEKEVDDIWAQMQMENEIKPVKRVKTDETGEQPVEKKQPDVPKEKSRKEALAEAAAKALEALQAMKK